MPASYSSFSLVGVDVGGTFTDVVHVVDGTLQVHKEATTSVQHEGVIRGLEAVDAAPETPVAHGTTVATNALLERCGARTALLTTRGFADVLAIGRQNRPHLYRLHQHRPPPLVPSRWRFEADERLAADGTVLHPLDRDGIRAVADRLAEDDVESLAIVFLFSFQDPTHEQAAAHIIRERLPDLPITRSSTLLPEYREYERTATTVVNAYVQPLVSRYLNRLDDALAGRPVRVMQSNGGTIGLQPAAEEAARLVLSGPAGGVVGAFGVAQRVLDTEAPRLMTLDMGGTSTDVALCDGRIPRTSEHVIANLPLRLPTVDIHTVGAGGGSIAHVDAGGSLRVGPQSAGATPGPACYGRGGTAPTVTDAHLVLGRLHPNRFLGGAVDLDAAAAHDALASLGEALDLSAEAAALGVLRVANATMERALRRVSVERGHDPRNYMLMPFGGAGPLHAGALADALGIRHIVVPPAPGVLSALGLCMADVVHDASHAVLRPANALIDDPSPLADEAASLAATVRSPLTTDDAPAPTLTAEVDARYAGQSYELTVPVPLPVTSAHVADAVDRFHDAHRRRYGHALPDAEVEIVTLRLRGTQPGAPLHLPRETPPTLQSTPHASRRAPSGSRPTRLRTRPATTVRRCTTATSSRVRRRCTSTTPASSFPPGGPFGSMPGARYTSTARTIDDCRTMNHSSRTDDQRSNADPIRLELYRHRFEGVADEMGVTLRRTSYSPNIKERLDFSCAVFDGAGQMVAQAAHIPVHLGAMPASMAAALDAVDAWQPGDVVILNDPYAGGTHLPDITMISPVFADAPDPGANAPLFFVASRAHHADVGGMTPGSLPLSTEIFQEGLIIPPIKLYHNGAVNEDVQRLILRNVRTPEERRGDLAAQRAAHTVGTRRLQTLVEAHGQPEVAAYAGHLQAYSERLIRNALADTPDGTFAFEDVLELEQGTATIRVTATLDGDAIRFDFDGTDPTVEGSLNAVLSITQSACYYVVRSLLDAPVPMNAGCFAPVDVIAPAGCLVNAQPPAAVAGGNVETSQRIVDVVLGALAQALPDRIPAASQGTMNNLTIGGQRADGTAYAYYETIAGGMGAHAEGDGLSGVHVHMTNTLNTPVEALERTFPFRIRTYALRTGSGGSGRHAGGDGVVREYELLAPATATMLSTRRDHGPWGLAGGSDGAPGRSVLIRNGGTEEALPAQFSRRLATGDRLRIVTPGGGGWGST